MEATAIVAMIGLIKVGLSLYKRFSFKKTISTTDESTSQLPATAEEPIVLLKANHQPIQGTSINF